MSTAGIAIELLPRAALLSPSDRLVHGECKGAAHCWDGEPKRGRVEAWLPVKCGCSPRPSRRFSCFPTSPRRCRSRQCPIPMEFHRFSCAAAGAARGGHRGGHRGGFHGGGARVHAGGARVRHGGAVARGGAYRGGRNVYRGGRNTVVVGGRGAWGRGYGWPAGGAIAAGAAVGFLTAGAAAAYATTRAPAPGLCWYYKDASRRSGFWDTCP